MPEGEGYQVFETAPVGMPPIAKAKADTAWGKQAVQATIRAWYNMMLVDQPELQSIKREWEDRFDKLPIDVELTDIDPALRLKWECLPVRTWQRRAAGRQCFAADARSAARGERGISDSLENPPISTQSRDMGAPLRRSPKTPVPTKRTCVLSQGASWQSCRRTIFLCSLQANPCSCTASALDCSWRTRWTPRCAHSTPPCSIPTTNPHHHHHHRTTR